LKHVAAELPESRVQREVRIKRGRIDAIVKCEKFNLMASSRYSNFRVVRTITGETCSRSQVECKVDNVAHAVGQLLKYNFDAGPPKSKRRKRVLVAAFGVRPSDDDVSFCERCGVFAWHREASIRDALGRSEGLQETLDGISD
jgi:hypothetical protein